MLIFGRFIHLILFEYQYINFSLLPPVAVLTPGYADKADLVIGTFSTLVSGGHRMDLLNGQQIKSDDFLNAGLQLI